MSTLDSITHTQYVDTFELNELLIKEVEIRPVLWDFLSKEFSEQHAKVKRQQVWQIVAYHIGKDADFCKMRWKTLAEGYRKFLKEKRNAEQSGSDVPMMEGPHGHSLAFLDKLYQRERNSSISSTGQSTMPRWWNDGCLEAIRSRRRAYRRYSRNPTEANLIAFKRAKSFVKRKVKESKNSTEESIQSNTSQSIQPNTNQSIQPNTNQSVQPNTSQSIQPNTNQSIQPNTNQSVQPNTIIDSSAASGECQRLGETMASHFEKSVSEATGVQAILLQQQ